MNNKNDSRSQLMAETFHGDWSAGPARELAVRAAAHARARRTLRRSAATGIALAAVAGILFFFTRPLRPVPAPAAAFAAVVKSVPAYEIISDDELVALLHDRPLLILPQERADRRFVILAQSIR